MLVWDSCGLLAFVAHPRESFAFGFHRSSRVVIVTSILSEDDLTPFWHYSTNHGLLTISSASSDSSRAAVSKATLPTLEAVQLLVTIRPLSKRTLEYNEIARNVPRLQRPPQHTAFLAIQLISSANDLAPQLVGVISISKTTYPILHEAVVFPHWSATDASERAAEAVGVLVRHCLFSILLSIV